MTTKIEGAVTRQKLQQWIDTNRPDLGIDDQNGTKGFYKIDQGQAWSFRGQGETWRDVAATLGAIDVPEDD